MVIEDKDTIRYTNRWFSYFDLLGFSELVQQNSIDQVMPIYHKTLEHLQNYSEEKKKRGIYVSWFSDTFIIFSRGGNSEDFYNIERVSRLFFQHLILSVVPVRGAMTYGELYSQQEKNIFLGPALIDAYNYGEGLKWLGFVLTPNAIARLKKSEMPVNALEFYLKITNENIFKKCITGPIFAFSFNDNKNQQQNPNIEALIKMQEKSDCKYRDKYRNTIEFINAHA